MAYWQATAARSRGAHGRIGRGDRINDPGCHGSPRRMSKVIRGRICDNLRINCFDTRWGCATLSLVARAGRDRHLRRRFPRSTRAGAQLPWCLRVRSRLRVTVGRQIAAARQSSPAEVPVQGANIGPGTSP
jgi:hypothetical protein